jgi:hypothetical protein
MKTKKSISIKRARSATTRKRSVRRRPIHKKVLLHPFTLFVLLCAGVLVAGSTFRSQAVSYDVTATVPAPALTDPAVITQPSDGQHVTSEAITVSGSCPDDSYVKLYRAGDFAGSSLCSGNGFSIQVSLSLGENELQARVFNLTDQEGPGSSAVQVYYDLPLPESTPEPASVPVSLQVGSVDEDQYQSGLVQEAGAHPTVSGWAPPFSDITVTFYSEPSVCKTKANALGIWSCTLSHPLPPGMHRVVVAAVTPSGKRLVFPTFEIAVKEYVEPFFITSDYKYQPLQQGQSYNWKLSLSGGTPPYELIVDWGDGSTSRFVRQDGSEFSISHAYDSIEASEQTYTLLITALDARGATTILQLTAVVKDAAAPVGNSQNIFTGLMTDIKRWLWVVWPVYIVVALMTLSFWIGEREVYQRFMAKRRIGRPRPHSGRR